MMNNAYKYQDGRVVTLFITNEVLKMNAIKFGLGALAMLSMLATNVVMPGWNRLAECSGLMHRE